MRDTEETRLVRELADLRMQVSALAVTAKNESLPSTVHAARSTVRWSALVIAVALVTSSLIKACADGRVTRLEDRIEKLEKRFAVPTTP